MWDNSRLLHVARYGLLLLAISSDSLLAESEIMVGTTQKDVLKKLGPPQERIEQEAKRESLWRYKNKQVFHFHEGKLLASRKVHQTTLLLEKPTGRQNPPPLSPRVTHNIFGQKRSSSLPFTGEDVFHEISKLKASDEKPKTVPSSRFSIKRDKR